VTTPTTTHTLTVPGATITYDVRGAAKDSFPVLLLVGSPMGASGFTSLASRFTDRTVVTFDPRGVERSPRTDDATTTTVLEHADDLQHLIEELDTGAVDIFASSGGAVNALELVSRHAELVLTLIAHEPPSVTLLPDREVASRVTLDIHETFLRSGHGRAMAKFIALASFIGPLPSDYLERPAPDPAIFGLPTADDGSRDNPLLGHNIISSTHHEFDIAALRRASTRVVVGVGTDSTGQLAARAGVALAGRLGAAPVTFPGGHGGFMGGEHGYAGDPAGFAVRLGEVLAH